ncbi:hypothetical protein Y032_0359g3428 [Ancylostoma ceylanicum]|uniref:Uncharacterized protein n=1 Tax=Ancylostoma ceylanicum TaxID=53326 RepID=A0A016RWL3_9BILA|nr:hypothetical protein Y032_0359g3428 [Ancylostoma ceylanicum]
MLTDIRTDLYYLLRHPWDKSRGGAQFKRHDTCASIPEVGGALARACALIGLAAALRARAAAPASPICLRWSRFQPASISDYTIGSDGGLTSDIYLGRRPSPGPIHLLVPASVLCMFL